MKSQITNPRYVLVIGIWILFGIWCLGFGIYCFAADENSDFSASFYKANAAYEKGKFDDAVKGYRAALDTGFESGNIYYNLGNAYFKKGEIAKAILNYKRAQRFIPQDADLKSNLGYARSVTEQQAMPKANLFIKAAINIIKDLSINKLVAFLTAVYLLIFLLAVVLLFARGASRYIKVPLIACSVIFILSLTGFSVKINHMNQPWAVILDKEVEVKYEPFDSATTYFKLFQGNEALLLKISNEWAFIKRPDGKSGWIKASGIEKI